MENFNLPLALREYRLCHHLSLDEMAETFHLSRSAYYRMERGLVKPTYEKTMQIRMLVEADNAQTPAPPGPWYKSRKLRWLKPILIAYTFESILWDSVGFREGYGAEAFHAHPPYEASIIVGAVFCVIYYYYYPPQWPFRKFW